MRTLLPILILTFFLGTSCKINEKRSSETIKADYVIPVNGTFQLSLASNPSTGYSWVWINKSSVSIVDTFNFSYNSDYPGRVGGGGKEIWNFKGKKPGLDTVKLEYKRVWETNSAVDTKNIVIRVK